MTIAEMMVKDWREEGFSKKQILDGLCDGKAVYEYYKLHDHHRKVSDQPKEIDYESEEEYEKALDRWEEIDKEMQKEVEDVYGWIMNGEDYPGRELK